MHPVYQLRCSSIPHLFSFSTPPSSFLSFPPVFFSFSSMHCARSISCPCRSRACSCPLPLRLRLGFRSILFSAHVLAHGDAVVRVGVCLFVPLRPRSSSRIKGPSKLIASSLLYSSSHRLIFFLCCLPLFYARARVVRPVFACARLVSLAVACMCLVVSCLLHCRCQWLDAIGHSRFSMSSPLVLPLQAGQKILSIQWSPEPAYVFSFFFAPLCSSCLDPSLLRF